MAVNFLQNPGTNGFITAPFNILSTETAFNSLANGSSVTSTVIHGTGILNQTDYANAIWMDIYFLSGGAVTPAAAGYLAGWFLLSPDGGTTFEKVVSNTDLPRTPDFMIPLFASAYATSDFSKASGPIRVPSWSHKVFLVNHSGQTLASSGNLIKAGPTGIQAV